MFASPAAPIVTEPAFAPSTPASPPATLISKVVIAPPELVSETLPPVPPARDPDRQRRMDAERAAGAAGAAITGAPSEIDVAADVDRTRAGRDHHRAAVAAFADRRTVAAVDVDSTAESDRDAAAGHHHAAG